MRRILSHESFLVIRPLGTLALREDGSDAARMLLHGLHTLSNVPSSRHRKRADVAMTGWELVVPLVLIVVAGFIIFLHWCGCRLLELDKAAMFPRTLKRLDLEKTLWRKKQVRRAKPEET